MRIAYTETDVNLLAHLMKAKAERQQGILDIGNVGVYRAMCDCLDFKGIPATNSLWFFNPVGNCPPVWWNQTGGQYKEHCFYQPTRTDCPKVYTGK
ncbi:hypothetical protein [Bacillus pseudomycoides]|uniref:hypothetical protein n=1 Tax=Bacillus pseudomycoides TaxID=64104 RepID=UPI000BEBAEB6|nr:hypothetical protein [Bacillus pseudomycoides]PEE44123.1 hypothetical protein COO02_04050 [Bacillus pseudomycoides]PGA90578.1 hypothetical protein COL91_13815 [Bacillus pseudomycoides]PHF35743.1 hypothetical protein COF72_25075 [Bacillus pseudomycoides]